MAPTFVSAPSGESANGGLGGVDFRSKRLGDGDGKDIRGGVRAAFLRMNFFEPGGVSINFSQAILAAGSKVCKGRALSWPFKVTRGGLEELMVMREGW